MGDLGSSFSLNTMFFLKLHLKCCEQEVYFISGGDPLCAGSMKLFLFFSSGPKGFPRMFTS